MARRRQPTPDELADAVDELEVRRRAAQRAYLMAGGLSKSTDWDGADGAWWERWSQREHELYHGDREDQVAHVEKAIDRLGARELYETWLVRVRRQMQQNTPAMRARRRATGRRS